MHNAVRIQNTLLTSSYSIMRNILNGSLIDCNLSPYANTSDYERNLRKYNIANALSAWTPPPPQQVELKSGDTTNKNLSKSPKVMIH